MPKTTKSARKPQRAKRKVTVRKSSSRKIVTKKKITTRKPVAKKKVAPQKKAAAKKKVTAPKKVAPKKAAAQTRKKTVPKLKVEAKPKAARSVAAVAGAPAVVKRSKSRLIKAGTAPEGQSAASAQSSQSGDTATTLQVGQMAPDFRLPADDGRVISLSDFRGKKVVLYFYPKDDTPGCMKEACSFRDGLTAIEQRGAVVLGVSVDPVVSHEAFHEKYSLNFPLLSDESKETVQAYAVWTQKEFQGRTWMAIERTTFIIDENGRITRIFPKVQVDGHFDEVLVAL